MTLRHALQPGRASLVAVIGATSWGCTLAAVLAENGPVELVCRDEDEARTIRVKGLARLPVLKIPENVRPVTGEPREQPEFTLIAVPSHALRSALRGAATWIGRGPVLLACKGLEAGTGLRMSEVSRSVLPEATIGVLSGPNIAREIAQGLPATSVAAFPDEAVARGIQARLMTGRFRVYTNSDVAGVELGGALKNVIALGAGMGDGLRYGDNAKAAFMTRGLAEVARLGVNLGADPLTFQGLAGLGDMIVTCFSPLSRNRRLGEMLAEGLSLREATDEIGEVVEGVPTCEAVVGLSRSRAVEMPISEMIARVLFQGLPAGEAVAELMGRRPAAEFRPG